MMNAVIYIRTSTKDQSPELQLADCQQFAQSKGYNVHKVIREQLSGFKDIERPGYNEVLELAHKGQIGAVIVWGLDRWVRNRDTLLEDVATLRRSNVKLHSVREQWLEAINIEGSLGRTIQEFLLGLVGSLAEMESERKGSRVRQAVRREGNITLSYKGKKWGRKALPESTQKEIIELHRSGKSIREIAKTVRYWRNGNDFPVSVGTVHKLLSELNEGKTIV